VLFVLFAFAVVAVGAADAATSPKALRAAILRATSAKHSVHYVTASSGLGERIRMVSDVAANRGVQRVTFSRSGKTGHATTLLVNSTAYIYADAFALQEYMRFPASFASHYAEKWISIPRTSRYYQPAARDVTLGSFISDGLPRQHLSVIRATVGGRTLRGLRGTAPEGGTLTLYVPLSGSPLPVAGREVVKAVNLTSRVSMSRWNEPVRLKAPAHVVPIPS
jgi:hypothetical protein